ncbi:MAG: flagellar assembly protein FliW [Acidimicrobiia bacterium]
MKVETTRFGVIEVGDEAIFTLADGLPGFEGPRRMALLGSGQVPGHPDVHSEQQTMYWLQDVDDGALAFLCIVPWVAFPEYEIDLDVDGLGITDERDVCVLTIVTVRRDQSGVQLSANLRAPVVINAVNRQARQVILTSSRWPVVAVFAGSGAMEVV